MTPPVHRPVLPGLLALACLFALPACQDFDPYQKIDYGQTALDRRLKRGEISQYEYDKAIKNFNPQGNMPTSGNTTSGNTTSGAPPGPPPMLNTPPPNWR